MSRADTTDHVDPITLFDEATDLAATDDARGDTAWEPNPRAGQLIQMLLLGAILLAPLLALLFRVEFALFIAAVALGMTAYLSLEGAKSAPPDKKLRAARTRPWP